MIKKVMDQPKEVTDRVKKLTHSDWAGGFGAWRFETSGSIQLTRSESPRALRLRSAKGLVKTLSSSFDSLRTNGAVAEIIGDFPFMLSPVDALIELFSTIDYRV